MEALSFDLRLKLTVGVEGLLFLSCGQCGRVELVLILVNITQA